jgi:hypothetical protein
MPSPPAFDDDSDFNNWITQASRATASASAPPTNIQSNPFGTPSFNPLATPTDLPSLEQWARFWSMYPASASLPASAARRSAWRAPYFPNTDPQNTSGASTVAPPLPTSPTLGSFSNPLTSAPLPTYPLSWSLLGLIPYLSPPDSDADGSTLAAPSNGDDSQSQSLVQRITDTSASAAAPDASGYPNASPEDNPINEQGTAPNAPNTVSQPADSQAAPFSKFLNAINPISPAYAGDEGEEEPLPPAVAEALAHALRTPEEVQQFREAQARLREAAEDLAAYRDDIPSGRVLGKVLEASGLRRPPGYEAHHIVAGKFEPADDGRKILKRFGIRINDAANGVWLPANKDTPNTSGGIPHRPLHTNAYMEAVNKALAKATTRQEAIDTLRSIGEALRSEGYP